MNIAQSSPHLFSCSQSPSELVWMAHWLSEWVEQFSRFFNATGCSALYLLVAIASIHGWKRNREISKIGAFQRILGSTFLSNLSDSQRIFLSLFATSEWEYVNEQFMPSGCVVHWACTASSPALCSAKWLKLLAAADCNRKKSRNSKAKWKQWANKRVKTTVIFHNNIDSDVYLLYALSVMFVIIC